MRKAFEAAFAAWETEYRTDPAKFMTRAECDGTAVPTLAEAQAACLISYLDELAAGRPWDQIGAPESPANDSCRR